MKKTLIGLVMIFLSYQSFSQQVDGNVSIMVVDSPTEVATLIDTFMKTDSGKSVGPASLSEWRNFNQNPCNTSTFVSIQMTLSNLNP